MRSITRPRSSPAAAPLLGLVIACGVTSAAHAQWSNSGGNAVLTNPSARVGIGLSPTWPLHLNGSAPYATYIQNTANNGTAVFGYGAATGGDVKGVWGYTEGAFGTGVLGQAVSATGQAVGIRGLSNADNGFGGFFSGKRFGIYAENTGIGYAAFLEGTTYVSANLGIGTTNPLAKLHVYGFSAPGELRLESRGGVGGPVVSFAANNTPAPMAGMDYDVMSDSLRLRLNQGGPVLNTSAVVVQRTTGNIGIGIAPTKGKLEINGTGGTSAIGAHGYLNNLPIALPVGHAAPTSLGVSLHATGDVHAGTFRAFSDERIKVIRARSDARADLETLMRIEVTDYSFRDTIARGKTPEKKVIGQQLETVYPAAVRRTTDVVPDIYRGAAVRDGWVLLATDLKPRDRVRLIGPSSESLCEVIEVKDDAFRVSAPPEGDEVFVYGREVADFRTVDYEAIAMLNVSATQELARRAAAQQRRIDELEALLSAAIEKLETRAGAPAVSAAK